MKTFLLFLALSLSPSTFAGELPEPTFSDFVLKFRNLSVLGWRQFGQQFEFALSNYSIKPNKNGSTWLYDRKGYPKFLMWAYSVVNADKTQKTTELSIFDMSGLILLRFNTLAHGKDLEPENVDDIRRGGVPYLPAANEDYHVVKMWVMENYLLKIENTQLTEGNIHTTISKIFADENTLFFKCTEQSTPGFRKLRYDLENRSTLQWAHSSFEVLKTEQEGQIWGIETYYNDEQLTDVKSFRQEFDGSILTFVLQRWQYGLGRIVDVLKTSN